jgi:hypothetical protein
MCQDEFSVTLDGFPQFSTVGMGIFNVGLCALAQVLQEVSKDLHDRLILWIRRYLLCWRIDIRAFNVLSIYHSKECNNATL